MRSDSVSATIDLTANERGKIATDNALRVEVARAAEQLADETDRVVEVYDQEGFLVGCFDDEMTWEQNL